MEQITTGLSLDLTILINVLAIILSIVALLVTVLGFFASLKFYRDGIALQNQANDVMVKIAEKANSIQSQVGGIFDKTLDAALAKRENVSEEFESLQQKLHESAEQVTKQVASEIQGMGQKEKSKVLESVQNEFNEIASQLRAAKESLAESQIEDIPIPRIVQQSPASKKILRRLGKKGIVSHSELSKLPGVRSVILSRRLRELHNQGLLIKTHQADNKNYYQLSEKGKAITALISRA